MMTTDEARALWRQHCENATGEEIPDVRESAALNLLALSRALLGVACPTCGGIGRRHYGSGSTWRGGAGTAAFTEDVCDRCWGTGRTDRTGPDLRQLEARARQATEQQALRLIATGSGVGLDSCRAHLDELCHVLERETRRRSLPEGIVPIWYRDTIRAVLALFRRLLAPPVDGDGADEKQATEPARRKG